ncbi:hypothetical protein DERP_014375 [Dermatophagoides pteronyssinus]|uniref:Uncharacterized protein n=1 Tax=Dermatophagoides pteronyssinus TaxID=6956 RepID=A0ABQ8IV08_DERPT|nr:hypothetical protein DERP_014375 [Dermatophagoides pteronyssinus]
MNETKRNEKNYFFSAKINVFVRMGEKGEKKKQNTYPKSILFEFVVVVVNGQSGDVKTPYSLPNVSSYIIQRHDGRIEALIGVNHNNVNINNNINEYHISK